MRTIFVCTFVALLATACGSFSALVFPTPTLTATPTANAAATSTAQAQSTAAARAAATAAVQTRSTATAQAQATTRAQATATTQAVIATVDALAKTATKVDSYDRGEIGSPPGFLGVRDTKASLRNFVMEVKFQNPGPNWTYRVGFRAATSINTSGYWLETNNTGVWGLLIPTEPLGIQRSTKTVASGRASSLDLSPTGSNHLRLVVNDKLAFFFVNGEYVAALDVSEINTAGAIYIAAMWGPRFENFVISALP